MGRSQNTEVRSQNAVGSEESGEYSEQASDCQAPIFLLLTFYLPPLTSQISRAPLFPPSFHPPVEAEERQSANEKQIREEA